MKKKKFLLMISLLLILLTTSTVNAYSLQNNTNTEEKNIPLNLMIDNITEDYRLTNNTTHRLFTTNEEKAIIENDSSKFDKSRPIYFAMDHVNTNDKEIRDTIVNKLKEEGFNVVSAEIGPNKMSNNTRYLYDHNISNAIIFHLFNGVDPSTIRELASEGNDNRGRIVRSNGNDVVLAWFYDSVDCVNENGSGTKYVYGSETGPSLENPRQYMIDNDIIGICTSSDMGKHKEHADYTGEKTVNEFMKLFN